MVILITIFFFKCAPGAFEIKTCMTLFFNPPISALLYCRWNSFSVSFTWKATKMLNLTQNGDIHCIYLFESLWKWLIVLYYYIILPNISVQNFLEKCNTKEKRGGGRGKNMVYTNKSGCHRPEGVIKPLILFSVMSTIVKSPWYLFSVMSSSLFLVACTRLYNPLCLSVGLSVGPSVTLSFYQRFSPFWVILS